jgi:sodium-dependent dicarboxylate transporter 2/3/5
MQRARACLAAGCGWAVRWSTLLLGSLCVLAPLPLLFVSFGDSPLVPRAAFLLVLMSLSWALTPWSIYVTSLFPLVLMPVLGLAGASLTASLYWNDAICLFLGSFVVTAAMERWLLHKRLALRLILLARGSPRAMLAAVMGATALLSLFMSNTATAALMVPLVLPIIRRFDDDEEKGTEKELELSVDGEDVPLDHASPPSGEKQKTANAQYGKSLLLGVAYSASMGGIGTLIGTGPNVTLVQMMRQLFPLYGGISFGAWAAFALVVTIVSLVSLWLLLVFWLRGHLHLVRFPLEYYRQELQALGRLSFEEAVIVTLLVLMTLLWITRSGIPPSVPGWGALLGGNVQDGTICIGLSTVLFLIPSRSRPGSRLLEPSSIAALHWDVMLLLGAGFAIGFTFASSGLTTWIGFQVWFLFFRSSFSPFFICSFVRWPRCLCQSWCWW